MIWNLTSIVTGTLGYPLQVPKSGRREAALLST